MRLITLNLTEDDDPRVPCGHARYLEVLVGQKFAHLLYVPLLLHVQLPVEQVARQTLRLPVEDLVPARIKEIARQIAEKIDTFDRLDVEHRWPRQWVADVVNDLLGRPRSKTEPPALLVPVGGAVTPLTAAIGPLSPNWRELPRAAMLALAVERGYVEQPAPNGGVAAMRVRNFLSRHGA